MGTKRFWFVLLAVLAVAWVGLLLGLKWVERSINGNGLSAQGIAALPQNKPTGDKLPVLWQAPEFSYPDQDGRRITRDSLRGHVWIADFIFTQCTSACPLMTAKMRLLQREIRDPDVRFVSFSVDPEHDTPAVLKKYAAEWDGDPSRWILLSTDPATLPQTVAGMKVFANKSQDSNNPILHSSLFMLVDEQGQVRGIYDSLQDSELVRLEEDASRLRGASPEPTKLASGGDAGSPVEAGAKLFTSLGCAACHDQARIAPPLAGVFGRTVMLEDGQSVRADDAYLRESITDPAAKIVSGYGHLMPGYGGHISDQQIDQLVAYLRSLDAKKPGGPFKAARQVQDVVCKMDVQAADDSPHAVYEGKTFYFCSDKCKEAFEKDPKKYVAAK